MPNYPSSLPLCVGSRSLPAVFRSGPPGVHFAQTLRFSGNLACPPARFAFGAHFAQKVSFSLGGNDTCAPDLGFCRLDCILGTILGKVMLFSAFGDLFDFTCAGNTMEPQRESNIGAQRGHLRASFIYRTAKIFNKNRNLNISRVL